MTYYQFNLSTMHPTTLYIKIMFRKQLILQKPFKFTEITIFNIII